jgi:NADPH-dependent glutamate synthase beta subunit-like oxidoreductase
MDVPSYVIAVSQGRLKEALEVIRQTNPLPAVCARVCHHPCEDSCNRALVDEPIAIMWLKRLVTDHSTEGAPQPVKRSRKERVAIVGSGPAGLTAAADLVELGYGVTIYEAGSIPGGMLTTAVPDFILPKDVALADIGHLERLGVDIRTGFVFGRDIGLEDLWGLGYKAVVLACGASRPMELDIPGSDLPGVLLALPWLQKVKGGEGREELSGRVVVIGGGNVAMDVARTALRLGAREVRVTCLESREEMPAFPWETEMALAEGAKIHPSLAPQRFLASEGGRVAAVEFQRVASTWVDEQGRVQWRLVEGPGSRLTMESDWVIVAIGQRPEVPPDGDLRTTKRGTLEVDPETFSTNIKGVFAAGDLVTGPGTVVEAMAMGRAAARSVHRYLGGPWASTSRADMARQITLEKEAIPELLIRRPRWAMPSLSPRDGTRCFREVMLGYPLWEGMEEAKRCLNCRMCYNCIFERGQLCLEAATRLFA